METCRHVKVSSPRALLLLILMTSPGQSQRPLPSRMWAHGRPATSVPSAAVGLDGAASFPGEPPYFVGGTLSPANTLIHGCAFVFSPCRRRQWKVVLLDAGYLVAPVRLTRRGLRG